MKRKNYRPALLGLLLVLVSITLVYAAIDPSTTSWEPLQQISRSDQHKISVDVLPTFNPNGVIDYADTSFGSCTMIYGTGGPQQIVVVNPPIGGSFNVFYVPMPPKCLGNVCYIVEMNGANIAGVADYMQRTSGNAFHSKGWLVGNGAGINGDTIQSTVYSASFSIVDDYNNPTATPPVTEPAPANMWWAVTGSPFPNTQIFVCS